MKFTIRHEIKGRIRIHLCQNHMTMRQADLLAWFLSNQPMVEEAKVYERTADAVIHFRGERKELIRAILDFTYEDETLNEIVPMDSGRELNQEYQDKLVNQCLGRLCTKLFLPAPVRAVYTTIKAIRYVWKGIRCLMKCKIEVEVLDATAIAVSIIRNDFDTAGSVMFLLGIGELLEEWTHKKSVGDLARSMSLNIEKVWQKIDDTEVLVPVSDIREGDLVVVHTGNVIPLDGIVEAGEAMVNQASMTGESVPVKKEIGSYAYAGTAIEEGSITIRIKKAAGSTRFERIVTMIEESEKLKSSVEGKASGLADALVPWSLGGTALTWLITRNTTKALSILMVDFSCALKLAMPLSVLAAMREASSYQMTVKGGKFLEAIADADTIVFDKTGTLTEGLPRVCLQKDFTDQPAEVLALVASAEKASDHPLAQAIIRYAGDLPSYEAESVETIKGLGIKAEVGGRSILIGNQKLMEEEKVGLPEGLAQAVTEAQNSGSSIVLIALAGQVQMLLGIADQIKEDAVQSIRALKAMGIKDLIMLTGDNAGTAAAVAGQIGITDYKADLLPEDKLTVIRQLQDSGKVVTFVGDGINDSPALAAADTGIAMGSGTDVAIDNSDVVLIKSDLRSLVRSLGLAKKTVRVLYENIAIAVGTVILLLLGLFAGYIHMSIGMLIHEASILLVIFNAMRLLIPFRKGVSI